MSVTKKRDCTLKSQRTGTPKKYIIIRVRLHNRRKKLSLPRKMAIPKDRGLHLMLVRAHISNIRDPGNRSFQEEYSSRGQ